MNFSELETYIALAETKSFSKTAANLFVSQSTVTHRLQKLEDELGYKLFVRQQGKRAVELTDRGEEFVIIAARWLQLYHEMEQLKNNDSSRISIAAVDSIITTFLPNVLRSVEGPLPFHLKMEAMYSHGIYNRVKTHDADIGFVTIDTHDPELTIREILRQKYVVIRPCQTPGPVKTIRTKDLNPDLEVFTSWGSAYDKWHDICWPTSLPLINVDTITSVREYLTDENRWSIVHQSAYAMLKNSLSLQVYELSDAPNDWVCYEIKHRYPRQKQIPLLQKFDAVLDHYLKFGNLQTD